MDFESLYFHLAENKNNQTRPFVGLFTLGLKVDELARLQHMKLEKFLELYCTGKSSLHNFLKPLQKLAEKSEFIKAKTEDNSLLNTMPLTTKETLELLDLIPSMQKLNIKTQVPKKWTKKQRPKKVNLSLSIGKNKTQSSLGFEALFDVNFKIFLDGKKLGQKELEKLKETQENLVNLFGEWVEVPASQLSKLITKWGFALDSSRRKSINFSQALYLLNKIPKSFDSSNKDDLEIDYEKVEIKAEAALEKNLELLQENLKGQFEEEINQVKNVLRAKLRPYQISGLKWLLSIKQLGLGAILADDMGLGKTIQIISFFLSVERKKASLVVCPSSLIANWAEELEKFAPDLKYQILHPRFQTGRISNYNIASGVIYLTSYGQIANIAKPKVEWGLIVADEAQAIKNPKSDRSKVLKSLKSDLNIALTGTPIENSLLDLWSLFDFCCPDFLPKIGSFRKEIKKEDYRDKIKKLIKPFVLRRVKTDKSIISDLPDKTVVKAYCYLTPEQSKIYDLEVKRLKSLVENLKGIKRKGLILSSILRLKQICNHPSQYRKDNSYIAEKSCKFIKLAEICNHLKISREKILVFTQFKEICDVLSHFLNRQLGKDGLILHGGTPISERQNLVQKFQEESDLQYFVLSLKAGGSGLNLTAANCVVHFDRWWNPAVENQASDRAYRIGQKRNVIIHPFICKGTLEEKIDNLISEKMDLVQDFFSGKSEFSFSELSNDELSQLLSRDEL